MNTVTSYDGTLPPMRPWDIGTGVAGYAWDAPNASAVVLLQHGFGEYAERFVAEHSALIPSLLRAGISVRAIDMRGHGNSPGKRGRVDVNRAVRDHLRARTVLRSQRLPVFLFGHSLGGLVTIASVCSDFNGIQGVVLSSPVFHVPDSKVLRLLTRILAAILPGLPIGPGEGPDGLSRDAERVSAFIRDPRRGAAPVGMLVAATTLDAVHRSRTRMNEWKVPTLVFHGTADRHAEAAGSQAFISQIKSVDKLLHLEVDGRHELLNDLCWRETRTLVMDWLKARAG